MVFLQPESTPSPSAELAAGDTLYETCQGGPLWQLLSGALRLDRVDAQGEHFVQWALPGDLIGLERLAGPRYTHTARALVRSVARQLPLQLPLVGPDAGGALTAECVLQLQRRGEDLVRLRSGAAQDRLKHLVMALAPVKPGHDASNPLACELPSIRDMAAIIDSTPETVSRIFACLRRSRLLEARGRGAARFSPRHLQESIWPTPKSRSEGARARQAAHREAAAPA